MTLFWTVFGLIGLLSTNPANAFYRVDDLLYRSVKPGRMATPLNISKYLVPSGKSKDYIRSYCQNLRSRFADYGWKEDPCGRVAWRADLQTANGHPLVYAVFGEGQETTLLLGGVHPDELTPIPLAFQFANHLNENPHLFRQHGVRVIIAPLVNPDGFLSSTASRTNSNGVDLNRNFFTLDWYDRATKWWSDHRNKHQRYFPGQFPNSEIETLFQIKLIEQHYPDKILSVHAPLGFLDYDGPGDQKPRHLSKTENRAKQLVHAISRKIQNYKVVDYSFYPGSLGNYAGNERHIPTVTLELETTNPAKIHSYWRQFLPGLIQTVQYPFKTQNTPLEYTKSQFYGQYYRKMLMSQIQRRF